MQRTNPRLSKFLLDQQIPDPIPSSSGNSSGKTGTASSSAKASSKTSGSSGNGSSAQAGKPASGPAISPAAAEAASILERNRRGISALDQVTQVAVESCHCIHLQEFLPHILDLNLVKTKKGWDLENPIHALHLVSQLEGRKSEDYSAGDPQITFARHKLTTPLQHPPVLFGEEQQRTMAVTTDGIVEYWSPLDGRSSLHDGDLPPLTAEDLAAMKDAPKPPSSASLPVPSKTVSGSVGQNPTKSPSTRATSMSSPMAKKGSRPLPAPPAGAKASEGTEGTSKPESSQEAVPASAASSSQPGTGAAPTKEEAKTKPADATKSEDIKKDDDGSAKDSTKPEEESSAPTSSSTKPDSSAKPEAVTSTQPSVSGPIPVQSTPKQDVPASPTPKKSEATAAPADKVSSASTPQQRKSQRRSSEAMPQSQLSDQRFTQLRLEEDRIKTLRRTLGSKRFKKKPVKKKKGQTSDKSRDSSSAAVESLFKPSGLPGWDSSEIKERNQEEQEELDAVAKKARSKVESWMDTFRLCRQTDVDERKELHRTQQQSHTRKKRSFFQLEEEPQQSMRCCQVCSTKTKGEKYWKRRKKQKYADELLNSDDLMQCLECSFIGCMPSSVSSNSRQHILQHMLLTGHTFAVTCGERFQLFCFKCGDFVYHPLFTRESDRLECAERLPLMAWKDHTVQRSFDAFQFLRTQDHGVVWRGLVASYPSLVPQAHLQATEVSMKRHALFEGSVQENWLIPRPTAMAFASSQAIRDDNDRYRISAPVGMYNLGNTCFQSAVLQCLVHCMPLQRYFTQSIGHDFIACNIYRHADAAKRSQDTPKTNSKQKQPPSVCVACEMDRLYLQYYGSTVGTDVIASIVDACGPPSDDFFDSDNSIETVTRGEPLITSDILTTAWKSGGMDHLAGYEQRDAHEFLNSFLDLLGKHSAQHRDRIYSSINVGVADNAIVPASERTGNDIIKDLFEGTLRSVLLCEECGGKRMLVEPFMNISLTLSDEVERRASMSTATSGMSAATAPPGGAAAVTSGTTPTSATATTTAAATSTSSIPTTRRSAAAQHGHLSVQTCLEHYILPEKLSDPVHCPHCKKKTSTKKQHTFGKLPKILCLHLKRFDAAKNRKIDEYVSFPAKGLNMGPFLSHWSELSRKPKSAVPTVEMKTDSLTTTTSTSAADPNTAVGGTTPALAAATAAASTTTASATSSTTTSPKCYYDLFGTANHVGNMESGHYVSNVNVDGIWYHCNDAHVSQTNESDVVHSNKNNNDGNNNNTGGTAYVLFYARR